MSQAFIRRLSDLENVLVVGDNRELFEREKRFYYNVVSVSTLGLIIAMRACLGEIDQPEWLTAQLERPIPADAPKWLVEKATAQAKGLDSPGYSDKEHLRQETDRIIASHAKIAGQPMDSLADVQEYLEKREKERRSYVSQKPSH